MFIFIWLETLKLAELDIQVWQGHKQLDPNICLVEVTPPVSPQAGIRPIPIIPPQRITGDPNKNSGTTPFNTHCMELMANKGGGHDWVGGL